MNFNNLRSIKIEWLVPVFALVASYIFQINYDAWRRYSPPKITASFNQYIEPQPLSASAARTASFGAKEFMADLYWLQMIQYYGGGDPNGEYRKLAELFSTITDLSPQFLHAYQTGLLVLPGEGFVDEAIMLGEKGITNLPSSWEMPYYTGIVHHIYKKDYKTAGEYFEAAAKLPGAPENARYLAAIYFNSADQRLTAYALFKTIYESSDDGYIKERAAKYLIHLEGIFLLNEKIAEYKSKFGRLPDNLSQLVASGIISQLPISPLGVSYNYDPTTGKVIETK